MEKWEYAIRISKLPNGIHHYDFLITNTLKEKFESQLVNYFDVKAHLKVHKTSDFIEVNFHFKGKVGLNCDRCFVEYDYPIETTRKVIYTFKPISRSDDDEVLFLSNTDYLDFSQEFYDFICLEIPQRKVPMDCPRAECPVFSDVAPEEDSIDPRWEKLLKLKNSED